MAKLATLTDDFPGSSLDAAKWTVGSGAEAVSGHRLVVDTAGGASAITSAHTYDATGSQFIIRGGAGVVDDTARAALQLVSDGGSLGVFLIGTRLSFRIDRGGAATDVTKTYDPTTDAYWRIRESLGQALFSTSPSGISGSWTTYRQEFHGLNLTAVTVSLTASGYVASGTGWGHATFGHGPFGGA